MNNGKRPLTPRQSAYITGVLSGLSETAAARQAGYGAAYSKKAASRAGTLPAVKAAIEQEQAKLREEAKYDVQQAVQEIDKAVVFACQQKNPMSIAKLLENKGKLFGLYVDRYQEVPLDLRGALDRAEARVLNMTPIGASSPVAPLPLPSKTAIRWSPRLPGDPEAGQAESK
jgi:Terminase small subunit